MRSQIKSWTHFRACPVLDTGNDTLSLSFPSLFFNYLNVLKDRDFKRESTFTFANDPFSGIFLNFAPRVSSNIIISKTVANVNTVLGFSSKSCGSGKHKLSAISERQGLKFEIDDDMIGNKGFNFLKKALKSLLQIKLENKKRLKLSIKTYGFVQYTINNSSKY